MTLTREHIIDYAYKSKPVIDFYCSAMVIGFWPEFPDYQIEKVEWYFDRAEVNSIEVVDELLIKHKEILNKYIAHIYANNRKNCWRVTPHFLCCLAIIAKSPESFTVDSLVENGFDEDIASIIIKAANTFNLSLPNEKIN